MKTPHFCRISPAALSLFILTSCTSYVSLYNSKGIAQLEDGEKVRIVLTDGSRVKGHVRTRYNGDGQFKLKKDTVDVARISTIELKGGIIWHDNIVYIKDKESPVDRLQINDRLEVFTNDYRVLKGKLMAFDDKIIEIKPGGKANLASIQSIQKVGKLSTRKTVELLVVGVAVCVIVLVWYFETFR